MKRTSIARSLYKLYYLIKARCYYASKHNFPYYQGKGIKMCQEWLDDKSIFYSWAIESGWKIGLSIDRIDSSKDYCPENCRFISISENSKKARLIKSILSTNDRRYKLSPEDVISIKRDLLQNVPGVILAKKFNVDKTAIYKIKHNRRWNHIEIPI